MEFNRLLKKQILQQWTHWKVNVKFMKGKYKKSFNTMYQKQNVIFVKKSICECEHCETFMS